MKNLICHENDKYFYVFNREIAEMTILVNSLFHHLSLFTSILITHVEITQNSKMCEMCYFCHFCSFVFSLKFHIKLCKNMSPL